MNGEKYLIIVGGATATGKTDMAIRLAERFETEILSADSRQFYREMSIGTAKPSAAQLSAVKHHFIDHRSIHDVYNVGEYEREALGVLEQLFEDKQYVVMVGGTGLYIQAVCEGLDEFPAVPLAVRHELEGVFAREGIGALQRELAVVDPVYYSQVDVRNAVRLIRALSVSRVSGAPFSSFQGRERKARFFTPLYFNLSVDRGVLYERINRRVDVMIEMGLLDEARGLIEFRYLNALQTVGYQELFDYFDGVVDLEWAVGLIKQHTRNYAKRQVTWFGKGGWERVLDFDEIVFRCLSEL